MIGTIQHFSLNDIDREEPTDFPPVLTEDYPTEKTTLIGWLFEYFTEEVFFGDKEEVKNTLDDEAWDLGVDGSLYREEDGVLVRYSIK